MTASAFGRLLKEWRGRRGFSQLDLAVAARTTQRHLSFVESGRATPSREMILRLAATMDLPLRQQNALLLAAGYAPVWRERDLSTPELALVSNALDFMLAQHEPYPVFVVDRRWNLLRANRGALKLTEFSTGSVPPNAPSEPVNLAIALVSPEGLRPSIANWEEVALHFLRGVQADAHADGTPETADLLKRLLEYPGVFGIIGGTAPRRGSIAGVAGPFSPRRDFAAAVHNDRHARHAARRDLAGGPHRVFFPDGRYKRANIPCVGRWRIMDWQESTEVSSSFDVDVIAVGLPRRFSPPSPT
jgi:transcriptional regulator with XRE-family HTH domain